jgi:hypothetical protein
LLAREEAARKVILPVWKEIAKDEVARHSPILAGRLAALASQGIAAVVADIKRAVQNMQRVAELSGVNLAIGRLRALDASWRDSQLTSRLLNSEAGVKLVCNEFENLFAKCETAIRGVPLETTGLCFAVRRLKTPMPAFAMDTGTGLSCMVSLSGLHDQLAAEAVLMVKLFHSTPRPFADPLIENIRTLEFKPTFRAPQEVIWGDTDALSTDDLAAQVLNDLLDELERRF